MLGRLSSERILRIGGRFRDAPSCDFADTEAIGDLLTRALGRERRPSLAFTMNERSPRSGQKILFPIFIVRDADTDAVRKDS